MHADFQQARQGQVPVRSGSMTRGCAARRRHRCIASSCPAIRGGSGSARSGPGREPLLVEVEKLSRWRVVRASWLGFFRDLTVVG